MKRLRSESDSRALPSVEIEGLWPVFPLCERDRAQKLRGSPLSVPELVSDLSSGSLSSQAWRRLTEQLTSPCSDRHERGPLDTGVTEKQMVRHREGNWSRGCRSQDTLAALPMGSGIAARRRVGLHRSKCYVRLGSFDLVGRQHPITNACVEGFDPNTSPSSPFSPFLCFVYADISIDGTAKVEVVDGIPPESEICAIKPLIHPV
ncbi:hypothetical protein U1Q18_022265 [Sarracenia purpurea var. burkii]